MKVKCKKNFVISDRLVCSKGEMVDVEPFEASWFEEGRPWIPLPNDNPYVIHSDRRVQAIGYGFKRGWCEIKMYDGKDVANHYRGIDFNDYFELIEMPLTAENVEKIHNICIGRAENTNTFFVEGIKNTYWYDKKKIEKRTEEIENMLMQLPKNFRKSVGGGWSFLQMCMRDDEVQWTGLHVTMEKLMCLGIACGKMEYLMPKELWCALPAGVPYVVIKDE